MIAGKYKILNSLRVEDTIDNLIQELVESQDTT